MSYSPHVFTKIPITNISIIRLGLRNCENHKIFGFFLLIRENSKLFLGFSWKYVVSKIEKAVHTFIVWELTLIRGSEREVHMAISSRVLMSGYLFLANSASNSWSCCEVKWVRCRLWRLSFTLFLLLLLLLLFLPLLFEFVDDLTWSLVSSSWLSGLSGLWLGSRDPGSEIIIKKKQYRFSRLRS